MEVNSWRCPGGRGSSGDDAMNNGRQMSNVAMEDAGIGSETYPAGTFRRDVDLNIANLLDKVVHHGEAVCRVCYAPVVARALLVTCEQSKMQRRAAARGYGAIGRRGWKKRSSCGATTTTTGSHHYEESDDEDLCARSSGLTERNPDRTVCFSGLIIVTGPINIYCRPGLIGPVPSEP